MVIIVGLGNPGRSYSRTRHNIGFRVIDLLVKKYEPAESWKRKFFLAWQLAIGDRRFIAAKGRTFMNESGLPVQSLCTSFRATPQDLVIVYDDVNLPLGKIRIRRKGSSGGHKGIKSIIETLGTEEFIRIKLGIGEPESGENLVEYVLSEFRREEIKTVSTMLEQATDAIRCILTEGIDRAMTLYNG